MENCRFLFFFIRHSTRKSDAVYWRSICVTGKICMIKQTKHHMALTLSWLLRMWNCRSLSWTLNFKNKDSYLIRTCWGNLSLSGISNKPCAYGAQNLFYFWHRSHHTFATTHFISSSSIKISKYAIIPDHQIHALSITDLLYVQLTRVSNFWALCLIQVNSKRGSLSTNS